MSAGLEVDIRRSGLLLTVEQSLSWRRRSPHLEREERDEGRGRKREEWRGREKKKDRGGRKEGMRRGRCMWHVVFTLNMPTRHGIPDVHVPVREHRSLESAHSIL